MAVDLQNFVNEILQKEEISDRIITLTDVFSNTKQALTASNEYWGSVSDVTQNDQELIKQFSNLLSVANSNELTTKLDEVAYEYAKKIVLANPDIAERTTAWSTTVPISIPSGSVFNGDLTANNDFADLLIDALLPVDNPYVSFETFAKIISMTGNVSSEFVSGMWASGTLVTIVTASSEYQIGDIVDNPDVVDEDQETIDEIVKFVNDDTMTLKQLQENLFFVLFAEPVV